MYQKWRITISKTGNIFRHENFDERESVDIVKLDYFGAKLVGFSFGRSWKITTVLILFILLLFSITLFQKTKQFICMYR
jgi:hypothetical protein